MTTYSGGCQCGAVRFRVEGELGMASICHCRMCQKAFGGFYAPLVSIPDGGLTWTRGEPAHFQSSNHVARGFCKACGTPLTYDAPDGLAVAIGAFDQPQTIAPVIQYGVEAKLPYTDTMATIAERRTEQDEQTLAFLKTLVSNQHPDHDTTDWPDQKATGKD